VTFGKTTAEAEKLKLDLQAAEEKIQKASVLLDKLAAESGRWNSSIEEIKKGTVLAPAFSVLAASFITYLPKKDEGERAEKVAAWKKLLGIGSFNLIGFLSSESEILEFVSEGLPSDQLSIENALIGLFSHKSPLVIDPNYALSQWLINKVKKDTQTEVVSSQEKKITSVLELGIRFGKTVIVNEVDQVDSLYFNILRRDLKKQGARLVVAVGEKVVDWSDQFRLIFLSRNHSIKLEPHEAAQVCMINNLVTTKGLEEKLLSLIINDQRPELEQKKKDCLEQERFLKIEISKLEKKLLDELAASTGNILDNIALINSLEETKSKSMQISSSLAESNKLKESLEKERDIYRPHASKGTEVFLLLKDLESLSNMYCFSLAEFTKVFKSNLKSARGGASPKEFIEELNHSLFRATFTRFGFALQKKDKLSFALHLLTRYSGAYLEHELDFLLDRANPPESKQSLPSWANSESLPQFSKLNSLFPALVKGLKFEKEEWRQWSVAQECEKAFPPGILLKPAQKVLLVKVFREDRLQNALEDFACQSLGLNNLNEVVNSVSVVYAIESAPETPVLFVTSVGSDPSSDIEEFAYTSVGRDKFVQISMGGGQNEAALKSLESCSQQGHWLCLKNLHLVPTFLTDLEKALNNLQLARGFKLFLTTEEHPKFPVVLLETCFKVSYEAPPGIKMNVERVYSSVAPAQLKQMTPEEARLTFTLAHFHACLQERRTYIPQGWSKFYEFSLSDFKSGQLILETVMQDRKTVDWAGLYGLFENAIYGGRIDQLVDIDVLRAYLHTCFNEKTLKTGSLKNNQTAPNSLEMKDHLKAIAQLPEVNKPSLFGLPDVFQASVQRASVLGTVNALKSMGFRKAAGQEADLAARLSLVAPYLGLWKSSLGSPRVLLEAHDHPRGLQARRSLQRRHRRGGRAARAQRAHQDPPEGQRRLRRPRESRRGPRQPHQRARALRSRPREERAACPLRRDLGRCRVPRRVDPGHRPQDVSSADTAACSRAGSSRSGTSRSTRASCRWASSWNPTCCSTPSNRRPADTRASPSTTSRCSPPSETSPKTTAPSSCTWETCSSKAPR